MILGIGQGDYEGAEKAYQQASEIAEREGDLALKMTILTSAIGVNLSQLRFQKAIELGNVAEELSRDVDNPAAGNLAHLYTAASFLFGGRVAEARPHFDAAVEQSERLRGPYRTALNLAISTPVSIQQGDFDEARERMHRALALLPRDLLVLAFAALLEAYTGDLETSEKYIETMLEIVRTIPPGPSLENTLAAHVIAQVAYLTGDRERLESAEEAAKAVLSSPSVAPLMASAARVGLALASVMSGNAAAAAEQCTALNSYRGLLSVGFVPVIMC